MTIPRMRTITETIAEIKAIDPMTAVTPNCVRTLCKSGKIRCVFTGKKLLVDLDDLLNILAVYTTKSLDFSKNLRLSFVKGIATSP